MFNLTKSHKLAALRYAAIEIEEGGGEFSCLAVENHSQDAHVWYSRVSADYIGRKGGGGLQVSDFANYNYPDELDYEIAKGERLMWLAMLATLVKDGEDLKLSEEIACA